jgi:hypothetical protein
MRGGLVVLGAAAVLAGACATTTSRHDRLLKRASFDFSCTKDELTVTKIDDRTRGVRGCGHQATYVETCDGPATSFARTCTWVMNTSASIDDE